MKRRAKLDGMSIVPRLFCPCPPARHTQAYVAASPLSEFRLDANRAFLAMLAAFREAAVERVSVKCAAVYCCNDGVLYRCTVVLEYCCADVL